MDIEERHLAAILILILIPGVVYADCAIERAPVKTVTDADAFAVGLLVFPTTIEYLRSLPAPRPLPHDARIAPGETTIHSVTATLVAYRLTPQSEIHLVLSDDKRRTIVAMIPSPACTDGSRFMSQIANARAMFDLRYAATDTFKEVRKAVEVQGIGFFDFFQSQRGLAPNALSLYPVTAIDFTPSFQPKTPPPAGRRRAAGSGGARTCPRPSLTLTASRGNACAGELVTIAWQASNAAAIVSIDGIGVALPSSGSRTVPATANALYSGRASTSCGSSDEALAIVKLTPAATASLSGPSSVTSGNSTTLAIAVSGVTSWTLTSSLGNPISPSSGTSSRTATYSGLRTGTDTVTLTTAGGACGNITRTLMISVKDAISPNLGLLCCDGTRSPTCFSCSNQRGCCSSHRGVCGCP